MNLVQIKDALIVKYPNYFTISSETDIKQDIGNLFVKSKDIVATKRKIVEVAIKRVLF